MTRNAGPEPRPGVLEIATYVPGKSAVPAGVKLHKLSSNETPLGPGEAARTAVREALDNLELYPDGSARHLREAIADAHALNPANILVGNGSDEILSLVGQAFLETGDEVVYSQYGFLMYRIVALSNGAVPVVVPERNETADVDALLAAVTERTRILFLANPNNPTGTYLPIDEIRRLHAGLPPRVLLVLDAAYAEYVRRNDYEAGIELAGSSPNVLMTRTFSKIHGLAALRIGWCYGDARLIGILDRVRGPFNVNTVALAAGAAAIADRSHIEQSCAHNDTWLPWVTSELEELGLRVTPSVGNFILIHFPESGPHTAAAADAHLTGKGLVLRAVGGYGLPNALRLTIGLEESNRAVVAALREFLETG